MKSVQIGDSEPEFIDDPNLHDNRIRSFAHVRGNWASYIFIDPNKDIDFAPLQDSILNFFSKYYPSLECKVIKGSFSLKRISIFDFTTKMMHTKLEHNLR